jgi:hypothetical protein
MRKSVILPEADTEQAGGQPLNLEQLARVEVSSEDPAFPIDNAFSGAGSGWRADSAGRQTIRLIFDQPVPVHHISLHFEENAIERTQQFTLSGETGPNSAREVVRQQWNFSPGGSSSETENIHIPFGPVTALELSIIPDISGGTARASLRRWLVFSA